MAADDAFSLGQMDRPNVDGTTGMARNKARGQLWRWWSTSLEDGGISPLLLTVLILASVVSLGCMLAEYGFVQFDRVTGHMKSSTIVDTVATHWVQSAAAVVFSIAMGVRLASAKRRKFFAQNHVVELSLAALAVIISAIVAFAGPRLPEVLYVYLVKSLQVYLLIQMAATFLHVNILLVRGVMHPMRTIVVGFGTIIIGGALLLSLPVSSHEVMFPHPLSKFVGHLFTSTSAVCVTGLNVYDTGTYYTPFGQFVIMVLIQLGGLGIIIFGTMFAILVGRQVTLRETSLMQDLYSEQAMGQIRQIIAFIVISTLVIEAIAAAMLYSMWTDPDLTVPHRIFKSVFHAVSAFCNAGFALQRDSLISYGSVWQTHVVIAGLIILGGIGFPVQWNVAQVIRHRVRKLFNRAKPTTDLDQHRVIRLTLHSKVALLTSVVLLIVGTVFIFVFEIPTKKEFYGPRTDYEDQAVKVQSTIREHSVGQRWFDAWFQSVSSRTAGFNTIDLAPGSVRPTTHLTMIALMFIGGSPASTAGGIKTVTFAVIVAAIVATLRQRPQVEMFKRMIDPIHIRRAIVLTSLFGLLIWVISLLLMLSHPQMNYLEVLFETTSACGTVGLSTGVTPSFNTFGRLCLIFGMFAGRVGPLTLILAVAKSAKPSRHEYPSEDLTLG